MQADARWIPYNFSIRASYQATSPPMNVLFLHPSCQSPRFLHFWQHENVLSNYDSRFYTNLTALQSSLTSRHLAHLAIISLMTLSLQNPIRSRATLLNLYPLYTCRSCWWKGSPVLAWSCVEGVPYTSTSLVTHLSHTAPSIEAKGLYHGDPHALPDFAAACSGPPISLGSDSPLLQYPYAAPSR